MERDADDAAHALEPVLEFMRSLWAFDHALHRASIRMEAALGLTAQQRFVLRILGKLGRISPAQLAELLHVDRGSVTALLKRLEARQLVGRRPDLEDGRRVHLSLTARGRKLNAPAPISVEHAVASVLQRTSSADLAAVRRVLGRLVAALDELGTADER
jgi:DNA-binding MarR family transcriptional regulator